MSLKNISTTLDSGQAQKRHITVMVVDDERDVRESVCEMLSAQGYDVAGAEDGRSALDQLRSGLRPDVILLDLMMPGMNGWQFREEQKKDPLLSGIPVVVITATRNLRQIQAEEVIHKPVKPEELLEVVERWGKRTVPRDGSGVPAVSSAAGAAETAPEIARSILPNVERGAAVDGSALFSDRFIEMLGHDLRNPLSAMSITGGLISHQAHTPEIADSAARVLAIVDRMDLMIGHLLDFLYICLGREMPLDRRPVDLRDVCDRVVSTFAPGSGREIDVVVTGAMDGMWDRDRIEMLISTLMTDGFDRDRSGAAIRVHADGSGADFVRLEVTHRGLHEVDLLSPRTEARDGNERSDVEEQCTRLGLGMYVAQQIVLAHGGEMQTHSDDASGTRFDITLPRRAERP